MDRLDELRCFIAVVETGGFSKAADQRGVTQGMVSRAVATLERRLGAMLFHRSTRRVVPTDEGLSFYERCTPLLEELDDAAAQIAQRASALKGILRVALPATFGRRRMAGLTLLLRRLMSRYGSAVRMNQPKSSNAWHEPGSALSDRGRISRNTGRRSIHLSWWHTIAWFMAAMRRPPIGRSPVPREYSGFRSRGLCVAITLIPSAPRSSGEKGLLP